VGGSFQLLEELADIVESQPRPEIAEIAGVNVKRGRIAARTTLKARSERFVDDFLKRAPGPSGLGAKLRFNIVIKREGRTHALMLGNEHHDVKRRIRRTASIPAPVC
jgi:hypothetical protein